MLCPANKRKRPATVYQLHAYSTLRPLSTLHAGRWGVGVQATLPVRGSATREGPRGNLNKQKKQRLQAHGFWQPRCPEPAARKYVGTRQL